MRPLTPEQLGWSVLQATGQLDAERLASKGKATEKSLDAKYNGQVAQMVRLFGTTPGEPASSQDFEATLDQTLFLRNGELMRNWLTPRPGNLTDRLNNIKDQALAEELYLGVLTRKPTAEEQAALSPLFAEGQDVKRSLDDTFWALLNSREFIFNH